MISKLTIRSAQPGDAEAIAHIYVDTWRATYTNILPQSYLAQMRYDRAAFSMRSALSDPRTAILVAEGKNQPAGYIAGGIERTQDPIYRAEVYELYLLPSFQRQGAGRRLLAALAHRLERRHLHSMKVWTLAANPHRRFYERTGGLFLESRTFLFAGRRLRSYAYGWIDITLAGEHFDLEQPL